MNFSSFCQMHGTAKNIYDFGWNGESEEKTGWVTQIQDTCEINYKYLTIISSAISNQVNFRYFEQQFPQSFVIGMFTEIGEK